MSLANQKKILRNRNVCVVASDNINGSGGVARSLRRMIGFLSPLGINFYHFDVISNDYGQAYVARKYWIKKNNHLKVFATITSDYDANNILVAGLFSKYLIDNNCSLVHIFYVNRISHIIMIVCNELRIPYIVSIRGSDVERSRYEPTRRTVLTEICKNATVVTCVTHRLRKLLLEFCECNCISFYNSYISNYHRRKQIDKIDLQKNYMVVDGREYYKKGIPILIRALTTLKTDNITIYILGSKPTSLCQEDKSLLNHLEKDNKICFKGYIEHSEVIALLNTSKAFIQASPTEGCPNMLLEAMACNCPIISSQAGVASEVFQHKVSCFLFDPWEPSELAEGIRWVLSNQNELSKMTSYAKDIFQKYFDSKLERTNWINIYKSVEI